MTFRTSSRRSCRLRLNTGTRSYASMQHWVRLSSSGWYLFLEDVLVDPTVQDLVGADREHGIPADVVELYHAGTGRFE